MVGTQSSLVIRAEDDDMDVVTIYPAFDIDAIGATWNNNTNVFKWTPQNTDMVELRYDDMMLYLC